MRVLLASTGTRGDVQPLIALGQRLRANGHEVVVAAAPCFRDEAIRFGLSFESMGRDVEAWLREARSASPLGLIQLLNRALTAELVSQFEVLPDLARAADVVVGAGAVLAGTSAAQLAGVSYRYIAYTAQTVRSDEYMPTVLPFQNMPRWLNRIAWSACRWFYDRLLLAPLNVERTKRGLPAVTNTADAFSPPGATVLALDRQLSLPTNLDCTGAWLVRDERPLPAGLSAFLEKRPIFASFGSMPDPNPRRTGAMLGKAALRLGRPLITTSQAEGEHVYWLRESVNHSALFAHASVIVHHGGAGTTAAASRSGAPQVIVPHGGDQFGFANRAHALGVAPRPLPRTAMSVERLVSAIEQAEACRDSARAMSMELRTNDGLAQMVRHLESLTS